MVEGKREFRINDNVKIGQFENGMHWAEIRDNNNIIETVLTAFTSAELFKRLEENNIEED